MELVETVTPRCFKCKTGDGTQVEFRPMATQYGKSILDLAIRKDASSLPAHHVQLDAISAQLLLVALTAAVREVSQPKTV